VPYHSSAGVEVSPQSALEVPTVRAAVDLLAGLMGTLPLNVYRPADNGGSEIVNDHPAVPFIRDDANPWLSATELRTEMTADALGSRLRPRASGPGRQPS
jgi:phage portal protein BeeE